MKKFMKDDGSFWETDPECSSTRDHQTSDAARHGCTCPRALEMHRREVERRREHRRTSSNALYGLSTAVHTTTPKQKAPVKPGPPDLTGAACMTVGWAVAAHHEYQEHGTPTRAMLAKRACDEVCPVKARCLRWVIREREGGGWGGIYAGMGPTERRRMIRKLEGAENATGDRAA
jgi:hypothetical protein